MGTKLSSLNVIDSYMALSVGEGTLAVGPGLILGT